MTRLEIAFLQRQELSPIERRKIRPKRLEHLIKGEAEWKSNRHEKHHFVQSLHHVA